MFCHPVFDRLYSLYAFTGSEVQGSKVLVSKVRLSLRDYRSSVVVLPLEVVFEETCMISNPICYRNEHRIRGPNPDFMGTIVPKIRAVP